VLGAERDMCCAGCEAVARTIVASGLESYYETRTRAALPLGFKETEPYEAKGSEASLILEGVTCAACLWLIEETLRRLPGVSGAVNYATRRAQVSWQPSTDLARIVEAIRAVGYGACPYEPRRQEEADRRERRSALWRLFVAAFGAMQVMMYAFPAYVDAGGGDLAPDAAGLMRWVSLILTLPVVLFSCRPFFAGALQELRRARIGLDTPIALGIAGGFLASAWATLTGTGEVYFDSICMLAFLLLGARYAEGAARRRAGRALDPLLRLEAEKALAVGASVGIAPGERVPADGVVESGASSVDESLLTGESRPLPKRAGDELVAGSVNLEQPIVMRVTRVGADTRAAGIARLVERAAASRPRLVESAERAARLLTYVVIAAALAMLIVKGDPWIAVAMLVATCPCALALAAPVVLTRAGAALLAHGALLTRSRALEALDRATDVVLDKTGTLTAGRFTIAGFTALADLDEEACRALAAALEGSSRHPLAQAFRRSADLPVESAASFPGEGVEASLSGRRVRIGSERFCRALCAKPRPALPATPDTEIFLADERGWLAQFRLQDALRPDAAALVQALKDSGLRVHLASGDRPEVVASVATRLGIESFRGGMAPQDKLALVERLQAEGRIVAMAGDGLNDAPVLARADVSFAMGSGADSAQLQADVVLLSSELHSLLDSFRIARRALRLVRQNLGWAAFYNAAALPLAAAGWIGPWEAALGMGASSLIVLLNALRPLARPEPWKASTSSYRSPSPSYS
jgi:Cu2+-exporting ATPase